MPIYPVVSIVDNEPTFEVLLGIILADLKAGGALKTLTPLEYHTDRQRRWYKGVCLQGLSDWNGDTPDEWDLRLKALCGGDDLLKKEVLYLGLGNKFIRPTIINTGKRNMTQFIENILSLAITEGWPVTPPDKDLRKK